MSKIPTDLKILKTIYKNYIEYYLSEKGERESKNFIPIDIEKISKQLNADPDIIFGRLFFHLEHKYGYRQNDVLKVAFFTPVAGEEKNCIHFPYLVSIIAELKSENRKFLIATTISIVALIVAIIALIFDWQ